MLWKSIACAAVVGITLAGPANASQETTDSKTGSESAISYQSFLSSVKTGAATDTGAGQEDWTSVLAADGALTAPPAKRNLAEVLSHYLLPGQTFASAGAIELLDVEAAGWQQLMINGGNNLFSAGDAQIVPGSLPIEDGVVGSMRGDAPPSSS
ncbi:MAG: hypothetical protein QNJ62_09110 [Methyloceanibacter sp.]|nr:hypothetical protein [Methyloceanibacter sp.]